MSFFAAEEAVLGAILYDNNALHSIKLKPSDFSTRSHQDIFKDVLAMSSRLERIDATTLAAKGHDAQLLARLASGASGSDGVEQYAKIVSDKAKKRSLKRAGENIIAMSDSFDPADDCVVEAERQILSIRSSEVEGRTRHIGELSEELFEVVQSRMQEGKGFFGQRTGLEQLDNVLGGMQDGETLVIAGRPSMGKSSVATQVLLNRALEGATGLFFSLEMSQAMCGMRMMSQLSGIPMSNIKSGRLTDNNLESLTEAKERMNQLKIWVDDTGAIRIPQIYAAARRVASVSGGLDLVVVDYLQLCGGGSKDGRERDVAEVSAGLKALAKEMDIPVLILSQLNRSCEQRDDKRPRLADLRESGSIEQDADSVVMAYRPAVYDADSPESEMELIVRKNRNGPLGTAVVKWHPESMTVSNL